MLYLGEEAAAGALKQSTLGIRALLGDVGGLLMEEVEEVLAGTLAEELGAVACRASQRCQPEPALLSQSQSQSREPGSQRARGKRDGGSLGAYRARR